MQVLRFPAIDALVSPRFEGNRECQPQNVRVPVLSDADQIVKFSMGCTRCTAEPWMGSGANPMTRNKVDELLGGECSDHQGEENKDMT